MSSSPALPRTGRALRILAERLLAERTPGSSRIVSVPLDPDLVDEFVADGVSAMRARASVTWESSDHQLYGFGEALRLRGERGQPFDDARNALRHAARGICGEHRGLGRPRLFGGFAFDPANDLRDPRWDSLGGWQFVLPAVLLERANGHWAGCVAVALDDHPGEAEVAEYLHDLLFGDQPVAIPGNTGCHVTLPGLDDAGYQSAVATAVEQIRAGDFEKVVLARPVLAEGSRTKPEVLGTLAERYPTTFVFSFAAGDAVWLGATPERLVALHDGVVRAASLASSRPRGRDEAEDERLGRELFESEKERAEHAFVVDAVRRSLEPACTMLTVPREPELMKVANIQHLYTPVTGHVREGVDVLELVERMHPTPAVGGWPRAEALAAIRELEKMDRGWYAGPIGWVDLAGEGEFAVALRSALLSGGQAALYAGAGIVAGSNPEQELAETDLKFRPLRGALGDA